MKLEPQDQVPTICEDWPTCPPSLTFDHTNITRGRVTMNKMTRFVRNYRLSFECSWSPVHQRTRRNAWTATHTCPHRCSHEYLCVVRGRATHGVCEINAQLVTGASKKRAGALRALDYSPWPFSCRVVGVTDGNRVLGGQTVKAGQASEENGMEQQRLAGEDEWIGVLV